MRGNKKTNVVLKDRGDILLREGALSKDDKKAGLANGTIANNNKLHVSHREKKKSGAGKKKQKQKRAKKVSHETQKKPKNQRKKKRAFFLFSKGKTQNKTKQKTRRFLFKGAAGCRESARAAWHG